MTQQYYLKKLIKVLHIAMDNLFLLRSCDYIWPCEWLWPLTFSLMQNIIVKSYKGHYWRSHFLRLVWSFTFSNIPIIDNDNMFKFRGNLIRNIYQITTPHLLKHHNIFLSYQILNKHQVLIILIASKIFIILNVHQVLIILNVHQVLIILNVHQLFFIINVHQVLIILNVHQILIILNVHQLVIIFKCAPSSHNF